MAKPQLCSSLRMTLNTTNTTDDSAIVQAIGVVVLMLIISTSGYILVVHMMFKELPLGNC